MYPKLIKTEADYDAALSQVDKLMSSAPGSPEFDALELWVHLIEEYEGAHCPIPVPDPISAIRFRMEQMSLKPADLIPYLGSKSRVSEVLRGKRALGLGMIRRLNKGLGIPLTSLMGEERSEAGPVDNSKNWDLFPITEMLKRRWFGEGIEDAKVLLGQAADILVPYFSPTAIMGEARLRQSRHVGNPTDEYSLQAWKARVYHLAKEQQVSQFSPDCLNRELIRDIARLSVLNNGPVIAKEMLAKNGIRFVVEPKMPRTRLDGAAIWCDDHPPIVALTLRYDRLDNYWFTLCHELAHLVLHSRKTACEVFLDDLDSSGGSTKEIEADDAASEALIPKRNWIEFKKRFQGSRTELIEFALSQRVHVSVAAGRWRKETNNFKMFGNLVGNGQVKRFLC